MATLMYSMCGEGRGHATRVQTIVEMLVPQHRFVLLAARDAYDQLYSLYHDHPLVSVRRLPGLFFSYRNQKVDYPRSILAAVPYLWRLNSLVRYLQNMIERERPSLAITDFEPILPRAARASGLPWISLDHQHFLSVSDFRSMPWQFRWRALFLRGSIPLFYRGQAGEAISSFHHMPARPGTESIPRIGVLLRNSIVRARQDNLPNHGHLLVYIRKHAPESLWNAISHSGRKAIVYGLGIQPNRPGIEFREISEQGFVRDLATAECLVSTAGNQLVGEAFYLRKPVLAIPESGNFEQQLNGWLVTESGGGWTTTFEKLTPHLLQQFLVALPMLKSELSEMNVCGNDEARSFIERFLIDTDASHTEPFSQATPYAEDADWMTSLSETKVEV